MNVKKQFFEGLLTKNPVLVQLLGMCSTLAITTNLFNGLGMGLSVTIILICSNVLISALRNVIPSRSGSLPISSSSQASLPLWICCCRRTCRIWQRVWACSFP